MEDILDFFHCPIKIISRNKGRSAVAASACINGTRMENIWDGMLDYALREEKEEIRRLEVVKRELLQEKKSRQMGND